MTEIHDRLGSCTVLVVEDDVSFQQFLIGEILDSMGITAVSYAQDGLEGLDKARAQPPDLIILDIEMPRMNGFEMLRILRSDPDLARIPVIVQTAEDSGDRRDQMFDAGATDFVSKPISVKEFRGRVKVHLENLLLIRRMGAELTRIAEELADAAALQRALLPTEQTFALLRSRYGIDISHHFEPSSELGGDCWGVLPINDDAIGVYICDFAGHGVSAALNTFRLSTMLDRLPLPDPADPASYVAAINQDLHKSLTNRHYATFLFVVFDVAANTLTYAAGGAPNPLAGFPGQAELTILDGSGLPLGIASAITFENRKIAFPVGSFLFLYSDALSEAVQTGGDLVGESGVIRLVKRAALARPDQAPLDNILRQLPTPEDAPLKDDLTAVWIERMAI
jgi:sigma-B regulation protein RsbU (phosphoserine phosphatase)